MAGSSILKSRAAFVSAATVSPFEADPGLVQKRKLPARAKGAKAASSGRRGNGDGPSTWEGTAPAPTGPSAGRNRSKRARNAAGMPRQPPGVTGDEKDGRTSATP